MRGLSGPDIPNLQVIETCLAVLLDVDVDGEMGIHISHLVLISLCDANYEVVDDGSDCAEGCDVLARTVVDFDLDNILALGVLW